MSSRPRSPKLRLQALEARDNPAAFGETWYDPTHLTLSFAPDGTAALGTTSSLSSFLNSLGESSATFQILKAFQTWAAQTNLNIGLVSDSGAAFDESGALQGDPRYGDLRIGACVLGYDVVALATTSGNLTSSAGDIFLNTAKTFSLNGAAINTYDLFTVMLQEAGHTFGLNNSLNISSVMYEDYSRAVSGLSSDDVATIQGLYGVRQQDAYEGLTGNNSMVTAATVTGPIEADLTSATGVDWYKFTNESGAATWVRLKAKGLSLLTAKLEVFDAWGNKLGYAATTDPVNNDLNIYLGASTPGAVYFVKVSPGRSDVFGIGAYRLTVDALGGFGAADPTAPVDGETGANDELLTALPLAPLGSAGTYFAVSSLGTGEDVDYFRVQAPLAAPYMTVAVAGVGGVHLAPTIEVYRADGLRLSATVPSVSGNNLVVSVTGVTGGADYFVRVASATRTAANYDLAVAFRAARPETHGAYGTMTQAVPSTAATMTVYQTQVLRLSLGTVGPVVGDTQIRVRIYDSQNQLVCEMAVGNDQAASRNLLLQRGSYRVEFSLVGSGGDAPFDFQVCGLTDPEGISPTDGGAISAPLIPPPPNPDYKVSFTPVGATPPGIYIF